MNTVAMANLTIAIIVIRWYVMQKFIEAHNEIIQEYEPIIQPIFENNPNTSYAGMSVEVIKYDRGESKQTIMLNIYTNIHSPDTWMNTEIRVGLGLEGWFLVDFRQKISAQIMDALNQHIGIKRDNDGALFAFCD